MLLLSVCSFIYKTVPQFFEIFNFQQRYLGKRSLCPSNQPYFLRNSDKSLLPHEQIKLKKSETPFCKRKTAEDDNAKLNISPNIP